jgi:hypothetical protein
MENHLLSRAECSALRGLAILGIILHNYCHWLGFAVQENEYTFTMANNDKLWQMLRHPDWNLPVHLLSYFGHYGVPVFLFLSGFGLFIKYESGHTEDHRIGAWNFTRFHYLKLLKMMIVGFVAFTMLDAITPNPHHYHFVDIVGQMFMFINVLPDPDHIIWPGPYWFFGLMLELYVAYRLLLYRRHWSFTVAAIAVCWLMQIFCAPEGDTLNRIRYNFIGGMLPFGAGLLFARFGKCLSRAAWLLVALVSAIVIFFFSYNYQLWFWVPLFVVSFSVGLVKLLPHCINSRLIWMGGISAALFVAHPITRKIFIPISRDGHVYSGLLLYLIASVAIAWAVRLLINQIPNPKLKR